MVQTVICRLKHIPKKIFKHSYGHVRQIMEYFILYFNLYFDVLLAVNNFSVLRSTFCRISEESTACY